MGKGRVQLVLGAVVFTGLLGTWLFLKSTPASETTSQTPQATNKSSQYGDTKKETNPDPVLNNINSICVEYGDDRKKLEIQVDGEECRIIDLEESRIENGVKERVIKELENLSVVRNLGEQTDLEQYGLKIVDREDKVSQRNDAVADGITSAVITQKDGNHLKLQIGTAVAGRDNSYYALRDGEVLILDSFPKELLEGRTAFYKKTLISIPQKYSEGYANDEFEYLKISGETVEEDIQIVPDAEVTSGYLMVEPVRAEALLGETNADTGSVSLYDLLGAVQVEKVRTEVCGEGLIREVGLAGDACCKVSYSMNGETHEIRIGKEEEDGYDLMIDDDPALYLVQKEWAEKILNLSVMNLRASYIWLVSLTDLESVTVACEGTEKTWQIQEDGSAICGEEIMPQEEFLPKYQELIGMTVLNVEKPTQVKGKPILDITYRYKEFNDKLQKEEEEPHIVKVTVVPLETSDRYAAYLDGDFSGILRKDTVETTIQSWK